MRKLSPWLALLLCVLLLAACGVEAVEPPAPEDTGDAEQRKPAVAFSDMEYERPELKELESRTETAMAALDSGAEPDDIIPLLEACDRELSRFTTMYTLADIRACQDTGDEYYAGELARCAEDYSLALQLMEELDYACAASPMASKLEEAYFWEGFVQEYGGETDPYYNDASVELMRRESALVSRYRELIAAPVIELDGESVYLDEYLDRADGESWSRAVDEYYKQYNPRLAELYIELIGVRKQLAECLGYDSYEQMQYDFTYERDYSPEQAEDYLEDIKSFILPLYLSAADADYAGKLSYDYLSERRLMDIMEQVTQGIGGSMAEAFAFMEDYGLYDVELRANKANLSFQTYLDDYDAPFLFLDPYGDMEDLLDFAHEFGHYADAYVNLNSYETIDLAECYSQAMEFLLLSRLDGITQPGEAENLRLMKLVDTLDLYVTQAFLAQFESRVYAMDEKELSVDSLNALALELAMSWGSYDRDCPELSALSWIDVTHFFERPFYVISYPVSNDIAVQIFALELEQPGAGMEKFNGLLQRSGWAMTETAQAAGLSSPFAPGRVEQAAALLQSLMK